MPREVLFGYKSNISELTIWLRTLERPVVDPKVVVAVRTGVEADAVVLAAKSVTFE
jgi:hypothetical protein